MGVATPVLGPGMIVGSTNSELSHESQQAGLYFCAGFTWLVGGCFVALRFYTRRQILRILGAADWCMLAAWVGFMVNYSSDGHCRSELSLTANVLYADIRHCCHGCFS